MSISDISSMCKPFSEFEDIRAALREAGASIGVLSQNTSSISRFYEPLCTNDEVSYRPAAWQQVVGNSVNSADICPLANLRFLCVNHKSVITDCQSVFL